MSVLFLLAHAGGNVWEYPKILKNASDAFRLVPIEMPGDASKIMMPLYDDMSDYVDLACKFITEQVQDGEDIYLFGHSFGGFLIYEIVKKLTVKVAGVIVSGCHPYHIYRKPEKNDSNYCSIFGYSKHLPLEIIELFEPVIAQKIEIVDKHCNIYKNIVAAEPLCIPSEIVFGEDDDDECGSEEWYRYFVKDMCRMNLMKGGHFYWHDCEDNADKLVKILLELKERVEHERKNL